MKWRDDSIIWDKNQTDIDWITLSYKDVWTPVLRVSNPHVDVSKSQSVDRSEDVVTYNNEGDAFYDEMMTTRTTCDLDMSYYPFDIQKCSLHLVIVGSNNFWFDLNVSLSKFVNEKGPDHGSWQLLDKTVITGYNLFHINLTFERKPLFLLINILLPIIILALLTPVVFVLPKNSGERVGYAITMLLAISVYMTIVSENLPKNSQPMPLISIMIFIWYILDAIIVFVVILNTKIHTMNSTQLPCFARNFAILTQKMTSCITCTSCKNDKSAESPSEKENCLEVNAGDSTATESNPSDSEEHTTSPAKVTWKDVSKSVDKWCFVISYLFKLILPVVFLTVAKSKSGTDILNS